ncbi:leucyl/phenylalanyl-tRNA--protein transferase [Marivita sp. S2033]|uniref:leucyl/phenylalanyl-tRNA--protein transferase n=1 Tax=Marivita sp. S2033 TaxID=3373187 RepID=UPI003982C389
MSITPDLLLRAYRVGLFPMAEHRDDLDLFWVDPQKRGVLPLNAFRISRSLAKTLRSDKFTVTRNKDFSLVVDACADRSETWINNDIRRLYQELHHRGAAHSIEVWQDDNLVGGVYGVAVGAAFCGESMFSRERDASKVALAWLVDLLRRGGFVLFDTQFITDHLASLGAVEITRAEYRRRLDQAILGHADFSGTPLALSGQDVMQRNTQTS